jgi:hypothetical protein
MNAITVLFWAANHSESPEAAVFAVVLTVIAGIIAIVASLNKSANANWKNGVPYCPGCNRQISMKASRTHCRSCGYNLVKPPAIEIAKRDRGIASQETPNTKPWPKADDTYRQARRLLGEVEEAKDANKDSRYEYRVPKEFNS